MRLGLLLRQSHRRAAQALDAALAPLGLAGRHFGVLLIIDRDGTSTQRDLLAQTGGDKAGMARTVAELEDLALLARDVDAVDRRLVHLRLTELGETRFREARKLAAAVGDELVRDLDDAELAHLIALLQRLHGETR
ncbi:hypothetical protein GCM10025881_14950 [Pseudolysinimonas kribbensis]|uniref:HTH marR-type domain-containing protein n=2 Tax=Pseudolysinimonas kribbensis TaxID=433641 RepID=A0ABQ6K7F1_9MICO|nr:hypothetical protein GCM10025881_14950 [Pseudolysinimonas kribbensis]